MYLYNIWYKNIWIVWVLCFTLLPDRCRTTRICHRFLAAPVCLTNETPTILLHCLPLFSPAFLLLVTLDLDNLYPDTVLQLRPYKPPVELTESKSHIPVQVSLPSKQEFSLVKHSWERHFAIILLANWLLTYAVLMRYVFMHGALDPHCLFCAFLFAWKNLDEDHIYHSSTCLQHVSTPTSGISNL